MRKAFFAVLILAIASAACNKYEHHQSDDTPQPVDPTYQIGDYFRNDTLEGVVFATISGGTNGLIVSLEETRLPWCIDTYINEETGATNPYEGWNNTNILMANYDLTHYPVVRWSYQRNTWHSIHNPYHVIDAKQWFVPASNELYYLLQNQALVNVTLDSLGYPTLENKTYWSSTETGTRGAACGKVLRDTLFIGEALKTESYYVRAIRNF